MTAQELIDEVLRRGAGRGDYSKDVGWDTNLRYKLARMLKVAMRQRNNWLRLYIETRKGNLIEIQEIVKNDAEIDQIANGEGE